LLTVIWLALLPEFSSGLDSCFAPVLVQDCGMAAVLVDREEAVGGG
jgi:hypothetical protein